jgi:hypothetical protein
MKLKTQAAATSGKRRQDFRPVFSVTRLISEAAEPSQKYEFFDVGPEDKSPTLIAIGRASQIHREVGIKEKSVFVLLKSAFEARRVKKLRRAGNAVNQWMYGTSDDRISAA